MPIHLMPARGFAPGDDALPKEALMLNRQAYEAELARQEAERDQVMKESIGKGDRP